MVSEAREDAYYARHKSTLEQGVGLAIDAAVVEGAGREDAAGNGLDPMLFVAKQILAQHGIDTEGVEEKIAAQRRPDMPSRTEIDLRGAVSSMMEMMEKAREAQKRSSQGSESAATSGRSTPQSARADSFRWKTKQWLTSLDLLEILSTNMLEPLNQQLNDSDEDMQIDELEYMKAIGEFTSHEPLVNLLKEQEVLESLAKQIHGAARELSKGSAPSSGASKFFDDGRKLTYGKLDVFYLGLDGFIGPPNPNLRQAMQQEHTEKRDSNEDLVPPNYGTPTTTKIEWWFAADLSEAKINELCGGSDRSADLIIEAGRAWPKEQKGDLKPPAPDGAADAAAEGSANARAAIDDLRKASSASTAPVSGAQTPKKRTARMRSPKTLAEFEATKDDYNAKLREIGFSELIEEEIIAGRLYTGPQYTKYNGVLRQLGDIRDALGGNHSEDKIVEELRRRQDEDTQRRWAEEEKDPKKKAAKRIRSPYDTMGNTYTTTLHVIGSAVLKLGKLTVANKIYRGVARKSLPKEYEAPNEYNVRAGIENGFMSCRWTRRSRSSTRSTTREGRDPPRDADGMIDRGADLAVSQYLHEREHLFAPLTGIEVLSHASRKTSGGVGAAVGQPERDDDRGRDEQDEDSYLSRRPPHQRPHLRRRAAARARVLTSPSSRRRTATPSGSTRRATTASSPTRRSTARSTARRSSSRRARAPSTLPTRCRR